MDIGIISFLVAVAAASLLTEPMRRLALRTGFVDRPGAHKSHRAATPYLGGVALAAAAVAGAAVAMLSDIPADDSTRIGVIVLLAVGLGIVGLIDDDRLLRAGPRFLAQVAAATLLVVTGHPLDLFGIGVPDVVLTVAGVVAITNAWNFLDNMDGLCAGLTVATGISLTALGLWQASPVAAVLGGILAGSALGFLPFNARPASIFLGDAGSLFAGFLVAATALEAAPLTQRGTPVVVAGLLLAVPALDLLVVVLARIRRGIPVTTGGRNHFSHRLVVRGLGPGRAVVLLIAVQLLSSLLAVLIGGGAVPPAAAIVVGVAVLSALVAIAVRADVFPEPVIRLHRRQVLRPRTIAVAVLVVAGGAVGISAVDAEAVGHQTGLPIPGVTGPIFRDVAVNGSGCAPGAEVVIVQADGEQIVTRADELGGFHADVDPDAGEAVTVSCGSVRITMSTPEVASRGWGIAAVAAAGAALFAAVVTVLRRRSTLAAAAARS